MNEFPEWRKVIREGRENLAIVHCFYLFLNWSFYSSPGVPIWPLWLIHSFSQDWKVYPVLQETVRAQRQATTSGPGWCRRFFSRFGACIKKYLSKCGPGDSHGVSFLTLCGFTPSWSSDSLGRSFDLTKNVLELGTRFLRIVQFLNCQDLRAIITVKQSAYRVGTPSGRTIITFSRYT